MRGRFATKVGGVLVAVAVITGIAAPAGAKPIAALADRRTENGLFIAPVRSGLFWGVPRTPRNANFRFYDSEQRRLNGVGRSGGSLFSDPRRGPGGEGTLLLSPRLGVNARVRADSLWYAGAAMMLRF
jgi:hypothetical protein